MSLCERLATETVLDLVRTPSVSGSEEAAVARFVRWARTLGMAATVDEAGNGVAWRSSVGAGEAGGGGARLGAPCRGTTQLMLLGHIDTVPGEIPVRIEGGVLHGRGSVDAKGPLAAMLVAAATAELPPDTTVIVAAAVGEETPRSAGARHLASRYQPDACVIGEPSGADGVTLGYKGRLLAHARVAIEGAHTAGPEGSGADALFAWWSAVLAAAAEMNRGVAAEFERVQCTIRSMETAHDGLADVARLSGGFRLPPRVCPREMERRVRALAPAQIELAFEGHETAFRTERNDPVVRALSSAIRSEGARPRPKLKTGTADLNVVAPVWRCPIAAYGPGDSALDHTPHERLDLDEYLASIRVLRRAIPALASELAGGAGGGATATAFASLTA